MVDKIELFEKYIIKQGIGSKDKVANSVKSYVSYLNSVSKYLNQDINYLVLNTNEDIENISIKLKGKVSDKTIKNYKSAMKHYIKMNNN
ncbi:MAG: site-specific integrase [Arcobacter sp.]|uniref:site-specific integrase n=1 Tax=Arcobacter sp. TaxID=1872629 RepID=UPI002589FCD0|nr:site-specific integrase [Arcobacter sp.]MDD3008302.1 site-specific integrase [Arcobacter sp.]